MKFGMKSFTLLGIAAVITPMLMVHRSAASDHADTPDIFHNPGTDISDVYMFPSPQDSDKVVLAMNVHPLISQGQGRNTFFDPNVLYQFKIDNNGDAVEDLVIQARFKGQGPNQRLELRGPVQPNTVGVLNDDLRGRPINGSINTVINGLNGMKVFAGGREDSFFFDLEQFFNILPDRATPVTGQDVPNPNEPQSTTWRAPGQAVDFLSNGGFNVLSIVVEVPKGLLRGRQGNSAQRNVISLWTTTSVPNGRYWKQMDRLARPVINEVFATVKNNRHKINDEIPPTLDSQFIANDIKGFMAFPAGRSVQIQNTVAAVLVPDVLKADLRETGAAYLGYETGGATGGRFGGRKLTDDVIDISLGVVFGTTLSDLGLVTPDGNEIPTLTSDNVGPQGKHFTNTFPYLGAPR